MPKNLVRALVVLGVTVFSGTQALAAVVPYFPFSGRLTDSSGQPINTASVMVTFSFFDVPTGGAVLWSQVYNLAVTSGRFTVDIGSDVNAVAPLPSAGRLLTPDLFDGPTYLEIKIGTDPALTPRMVVGAMAYAMRAALAEDIECSGCVGASAVAFNYAGSASQGGAATDLACSGCIADTEVAFNYAGSSSKGGAATSANSAADLSCSGCVADTEVSFNYAGSGSKGGAATDLVCAGCVADTEINFNYAGSSSKAGVATSAADLACTGCVADTDIAFNYAGSTSKGGAANSAIDLACTGCVSSTDIADATIVTGDLNSAVYGGTGGAYGSASTLARSDHNHDAAYAYKPKWARRTTQLARISNTTLTNDDTLTFAVLAGQSYAFECMLIVTSGDTPGINVGFAGPAGTTLSATVIVSNAAGDDVSSTGILTNTSPTDSHTHDWGGTTGPAWVRASGVVTFTAAGNFTVQWAQRVSSTTGTAVESGSYLVGHRID